MAEKKGKLAVIKTQETKASVKDFINKVKDETQRKDSFTLVRLMEKATKDKAKMWGSSIIGFGNKRFKSPATSREVDWFKIGFSPRKANLTLYLILDFNKHTATLKKLGKFKIGGGCLYINKLENVDIKVLTELINAAVKASLK